MKRIYTDLGFGVEEKEGRLQVEAPWYRLDIGISADLVEEVARITGYDRIPSSAPSGRIRSSLTLSPPRGGGPDHATPSSPAASPRSSPIR